MQLFSKYNLSNLQHLYRQNNWIFNNIYHNLNVQLAKKYTNVCNYIQKLFFYFEFSKKELNKKNHQFSITLI
ncbi:unnamed protein product [Paramecium pentaurelia]|uniref:Uncharacterized protein n=1 Tax=Paramecium pentaurelia TaxID=43138 RepID=A0A8S1UN43_9CILI|nr:unnamed protein product [Paramecium pentaurelia]CAD8163868.1 unnamed protein product [Paramecium pentaurelia]CAD8163876.1 unnamed protein product [Paramecium pentaurelia]